MIFAKSTCRALVHAQLSEVAAVTEADEGASLALIKVRCMQHAILHLWCLRMGPVGACMHAPYICLWYNSSAYV